MQPELRGNPAFFGGGELARAGRAIGVRAAQPFPGETVAVAARQRRIRRWRVPVRAGCIRRHAPSRSASLILRSDPHRSEEHTSELQSLMRISYAVFCLKKKKNKTHP